MSGATKRFRVTHGSESDVRRFVRYMCLTLFGLAFALASIGKIPWSGANDWEFLFVALVLSQCSMVSIWACGFKGPAAIPCAAVTAFTIICWLSIAGFSFVGFGDAATVCWAIVAVTQALSTIVFTTSLDTFSKSSRRKQSHRSIGDTKLRKFSFGTDMLILWTTSTAIGLVIMRAVMYAKNWSAQTISFENAGMAILMGICGASLATVWLSVFRGAIWSRVILRFLFAIPAFVLVPLFFYAIATLFVSSDIIDPAKMMMPIIGQTIFSGITLLATLNHTRR